jgi:hypothetical protein
VTPNVEDYLELYPGDDLANIVAQFCNKWGLDQSIKEMLENELLKQLDESGISTITENFSS